MVVHDLVSAIFAFPKFHSRFEMKSLEQGTLRFLVAGDSMIKMLNSLLDADIISIPGRAILTNIQLMSQYVMK